MAVKSFRLVNKSERACLVERLCKVFDAWQGEWFAKPEPTTVTLGDDASFGEDHTWVRYRVGPQKGIAISLPDNWRERMRASIAGAERSSGTAETESWIEPILSDRLLRSLATALLHGGEPNLDNTSGALEMETADVHPAIRDSGEVFARCAIGSAVEFCLLLSADLVQIHTIAVGTGAARPIPLVPVKDTIANERVSMEVILGEAELTLDELHTLGVGDVIRLDRSVDRPLPIRVSGDATICVGYLGTMGDRKAIQLATTDKPVN